MNGETMDRDELRGVKVFFNPWLFTVEENNEMIAKGYEPMPLAIPRDDSR